jgi:SAM-dependent methyltransferase
MYRHDLAYIHHAGFSEFAESAAPGVIELLLRQGIREGLVVDVGCGSGVLARELTRAGFDVLGVDASPSMIELARNTAPAARFEVASLDEVQLPPCDAIAATGEVLNYGDARAFLPRAARALRAGGLLLFDVAEHGAYPSYAERRFDGDDWAVIAIGESGGSTLMRRVQTFRMVDGVMRRDEEVHTLELYDRTELLALLRPAFGHVRVRRSYGSHRLPRGHAVYLGVRRP